MDQNFWPSLPAVATLSFQAVSSAKDLRSQADVTSAADHRVMRMNPAAALFTRTRPLAGPRRDGFEGSTSNQEALGLLNIRTTASISVTAPTMAGRNAKVPARFPSPSALVPTARP